MNAAGFLRGLMLIVRRSLRQHALSTLVTVLSLGLAAGLVMAVFVINSRAWQAFTGGAIGYDAVLGARGSQLQLVLNTVFHLETSPGNLPWSIYQTIRRDPRVALAVPYAVGDNYQGYRIVGTTEEIFQKFEYQQGRRFEFKPGGRAFDPARPEAVIGAFVARETGLKVGSKFNPYHGVTFDPSARHADEYEVVGVLEDTNTPSDRVIWIPLEGLFRMSGHVLRGGNGTYAAVAGETIPEEYKEVSAVMLKLKNPASGFELYQLINQQGRVATLAWPIGRVMGELLGRIGWFYQILLVVAWLIVLVAAGGILASLYNTMGERRREFAILRALGARRRTIFSAILFESGTIALLGALLGFFIYGLIMLAAADVVRRQTGVVLNVFAWHPALVLAPAGMVLLGLLAGVLPALRAYATDVAGNLAPQS